MRTGTRTWLRVSAGIYGLLGLAGGIAIALFFAIETSMLGAVPRGDFFGPLSDWLGAFAALVVCVACLAFAVRVRARWWLWVLTALVVLASLLFALVTWLMIGGRATLGDQFAAAGPQILLLSAWIVCAGVVGARADVLPRWMMTFAIVIISVFAASAVAFGLGFAVPATSGLRMPLVLIGAIPGFLASTAQPVWWLGVAATAR